MKYIHLKKIPVKERQKMLPPNWSKKYFKGAYLFSPILILAIAFLNTVFLLIYSKAILPILLYNIIGIVPAMSAHIAISSGFVSCNTGSYFKDTEPVRFWITTGILVFCFIFTQVAMWYF